MRDPGRCLWWHVELYQPARVFFSSNYYGLNSCRCEGISPPLPHGSSARGSSFPAYCLTLRQLLFNFMINIKPTIPPHISFITCLGSFLPCRIVSFYSFNCFLLLSASHRWIIGLSSFAEASRAQLWEENVCNSACHLLPHWVRSMLSSVPWPFFLLPF